MRDSPRKVEQQKAASTKLPWENDPGRGATFLPLEVNSEGNPALLTDRLLESESWSNAPGEHQRAKRKELVDQPRKTERQSTAKSNVPLDNNLEGNPATQANRLLEAEG